MKTEDLKKLQKVEFSILSDFHDFCIQHGIKYSLYAGTALGAVRHGGFIPWDDDIDIIMTYDEYLKLNIAWEKHPMNNYYFQSFLNEPYSGIAHTKIRKNNTKLISLGDDREDIHQGIWLDIFILTKVHNSIIGHINEYIHGILLLICTRGFNKNFLDKSYIKLFKLVLRSIPDSLNKAILNKTKDFLFEKNHYTSNYVWADIACFSTIKIHYDSKLTDKYTMINFCGKELMIFEKYDYMLKKEYGNYMEFPPKEEQICKHNPRLLEFGEDEL